MKQLSETRLKRVEMPEPPKNDKKAVEAEMRKPSTVHVPIHSSHMQHVTPGSTITVHVKGKVKGVRAATEYSPSEVELEPHSTGVTPHGGKNPFHDLAEGD